MDSNHLSADEFFARLTRLFESRRQKAHGSIFLTQKRCRGSDLLSLRDVTLISFLVTLYDAPAPETATPLPASAPFPDLHPPHPLPILVRATDGKSQEKQHDRIKLSTVVQPNELEAFFTRYAEVWKAGMLGLKKRDRSGRKAKAKKTKKKGKDEGDGVKLEKKG